MEEYDSQQGSEDNHVLAMVVYAVLFLIQSILFLESKMFVKRNSKNGNTPIKYGRFRRNLFTYNQTMVFSSVVIIGGGLRFLAKHFQLERANFVMALCNIIFFVGFIAIIWPVYIMFNFNQEEPTFLKICQGVQGQLSPEIERKNFEDILNVEPRRAECAACRAYKWHA